MENIIEEGLQNDEGGKDKRNTSPLDEESDDVGVPCSHKLCLNKARKAAKCHVRLYECDICRRAYTSKTHLIQHLRTGTPLRCNAHKARRPAPHYATARLVERHFISKIPSSGKSSRPQRRCIVCSRYKKIKTSVYWCRDCDVGLCLEECFEAFHTKVNY